MRDMPKKILCQKRFYAIDAAKTTVIIANILFIFLYFLCYLPNIESLINIIYGFDNIRLNSNIFSLHFAKLNANSKKSTLNSIY